jgi:hypothetical protein
VYGGNVKSQRFINAMTTFKFKGNDQAENCRMMLLGVGNFIGEEDAIHDRLPTVSVSCFSTTGELFEISRENFLKIRHTDEESFL